MGKKGRERLMEWMKNGMEKKVVGICNNLLFIVESFYITWSTG